MVGRLVMSIAVLFALIVSPASAQVIGSSVTGVVRDSTGAAIPNAQVIVKNLGTDIERTTVSNAQGLYSITNVPAGLYKVTIAAQGFATGVTNNIQLTVGGEREIDGNLRVGSVDNVVEVNTVPADVEVDTSIVSATVGQKRIVDLPLNGRDWTQLATLQPGVSFVRSQPGTGTAGGSNRGSRGYGTQLTVNGHSPYENTYRLDGVNENDSSNGSPGSVLGANLGVDAIQEFSVITSGYTAEYGRTSGGVINAITRSGTNQVHGSAYIFDRDSIFDARNYFDPTTGIPNLHREQFGASLGGPIHKNKTFLFGNYEGVRQTAGLPVISVVPSAAAHSGMIHNTAGVAQTVAINSTIAQYLTLYPLPNYGTAAATSDFGQYQFVNKATVGENFFILRADQNFSQKNTLSATYLYDNGPEDAPDALGNGEYLFNEGRQVAALTETHVFGPSLLNVVRLGYNRSTSAVNVPLAPITPIGGNTTLGYIPGLYIPRIQVTGYASTGGLGNTTASKVALDSLQAYDDVSYTRGRNSLKFGFAYERINSYTLSYLPNGSASFVATGTTTALGNFLNANPYQAQVSANGINLPIEIQDNLVAGYVQDDFRVSSRLTVNLGVRYEFLTIPVDKEGRAAEVTTLTAPTGSPACPTQIVATTSPGCTVPVSSFFQTNPTKNDYEPRVGFAWNPFGDGKTAIRGAFGIYDQLPLPSTYGSYASTASPYLRDYLLVGNVPANTFPYGLSAVAVNNPANRIGHYTAPNPGRDYSLNYNLNIEQEYGRHFSSLIGYTGSHSIHTPFTVNDMNQVAPSQVNIVNGRYFFPLPAAAAVKQDVNSQLIFGELYDGSSHYNGLISQMKVSQLYGLTGQATYTWSKCIDYGSSTTTPNNYQNSLSGLIYYDKTERKGVCDFNLAQNFSANVIYEIPGYEKNSLAKTITGGFQVGTIVYVSTGLPFTIINNGDVLGQKGTSFSALPDVIPSCNPYVKNFKQNGNQYLNANCFVFPTVSVTSPLAAMCNQGGLAAVNGQVLCLNEEGNERRNSLVGPRIVDTDLSLIKNTRVPRISEAFNFQLRVEAFNVFNHANFQSPVGNITLASRNATLFSAEALGAAGTFSQTATTSRQIQLGAKFIF